MTNALNAFTGLRKLSLINNKIQKIEGLSACRLLQQISFEKNKISKIESLGNLQYLKKLDLGHNRITQIEGLNHLQHLSQLSIEDNKISQLRGLQDLSSLMELYLGNNQINRIKQILHLKSLNKLIILDLSGNLMCKQKHYRIYSIFHLKKLKVLDGVSIEQQEQHRARDMFAGRLTQQILDARGNGKAASHIRQLNLSNCKLRDFDNMFDQQIFQSLVELNLNNNFMETLKQLSYLPKLKVLQISSNRLDTLFCQPTQDGYPRGLLGVPQLQVLDISHNQLNDLYGLQFANLKHLKIMNASNNQIQKVEHLIQLKNLIEIDLSRNKIRSLDAMSFPVNNIITCLKMEDNGLRSLTGLDRLIRVQSLFLNGNRVADMAEIEKLMELTQLIELTIQSNPLVRKNLYRPQVIKRIPQLLYLDGKVITFRDDSILSQQITPEEKQRIESAFVQEQRIPMIHYAQAPNAKVPIKMNSINFDGVFSNMKLMPNDPQLLNHNNQHLTTLLSHQAGGGGVSSQGNAQAHAKDMSNLILVSSYYPQQNSGGGSVQTGSTSIPSSDYSAGSNNNASSTGQRHGSKMKRPNSKTHADGAMTTISGTSNRIAAGSINNQIPTHSSGIMKTSTNMQIPPKYSMKGQSPQYYPAAMQGNSGMINIAQQYGAANKKNSAGSSSGGLAGSSSIPAAQRLKKF